MYDALHIMDIGKGLMDINAYMPPPILYIWGTLPLPAS